MAVNTFLVLVVVPVFIVVVIVVVVVIAVAIVVVGVAGDIDFRCSGHPTLKHVSLNPSSSDSDELEFQTHIFQSCAVILQR